MTATLPKHWGVFIICSWWLLSTPQSYQIENSLHNKIKLAETMKLNKHRDTELRGLSYPRNGLSCTLLYTLKESYEKAPWAAGISTPYSVALSPMDNFIGIFFALKRVTCFANLNIDVATLRTYRAKYKPKKFSLRNFLNCPLFHQKIPNILRMTFVFRHVQ
jgi:hypothetical protein